MEVIESSTNINTSSIPISIQPIQPQLTNNNLPPPLNTPQLLSPTRKKIIQNIHTYVHHHIQIDKKKKKDKWYQKKHCFRNLDFNKKYYNYIQKPRTPHNTNQYLTNNLYNNIKINKEGLINEDDDDLSYFKNDMPNGINNCENGKNKCDNYFFDKLDFDFNIDLDQLVIESPLKKRIMSFDLNEGCLNSNNLCSNCNSNSNQLTEFKLEDEDFKVAKFKSSFFG